jgi:glycosyltransferase involved in cell wall biosynthesis
VERVAVVYNSVGRAPAAPGSGGQPDFDIVTVARLVPWKGLEELIEVARDNGWSLRIVGDGPLRGALEQRAMRPGRQPAARLVGHVPAEKITEELRRGSVFALNSSYEGLPHVILEAMAAGVPVVATAVGGTPETIRDGIDGYLVPPGNRAVLCDRIRRLLADPGLRKATAEAAARRIAERFTFAAMVAGTERVLRDVLGLALQEGKVPRVGPGHGG